jgi:serine/threonine protein kinase/formylglycine-generating enzyme required for sulfatase activity
MIPEHKIRSGKSLGRRTDFPSLKLEHYRIDGVLGAGGMGEVFSGVHTVTQRRCALKLLPEELCRQPDFVTRFHVEAKTVARLNHPHVVQIYTGGESAGRFFLEMEYVDGGDLQRRVVDYREVTGSGLPEDEVRRVTDAVLSALSYAHEQGIVHRDLKPANILLSKAGGVKVSDFGLAAVVGEDLHRSMVQESITLTKVATLDTTANLTAASSSGVAGTILYMSPQALRGEPPEARDDLFSLGVLVYFMFVGRTPTVNYTPLSKVRPNISRDWDKFIATCLAEEREDRFANAAAARKALPSPRRKTRMLWIAASVAALLVAAAVGYVRFRPGALPPAVVVRPDPQTLTFEPIADRAVGAPTFALSASASSGLPVQFNVVSGPARIADGVVTLNGPGTVVVRASQPGNKKFASAESVERTFRITDTAPVVAKPQTIIFEAIADSNLGDPPIEIFGSATSGLPVSYKVLKGPATVTGNRIAVTGAGAITIRAEQAGDANFLPATAIERTFQVQDTVPADLKVVLAPGIEMKFVRVPAGTATLGSPDNEPRHTAAEKQREFSRAEGFLLGATEVSQAEYKAIMSAVPGASPTPSHHKGDLQRPVEQVAFSATTVFLTEFNKRLRAQGLQKWVAVLPSDDEWEYACRSGTTTPFNNNAKLTNTGDAPITGVAVYRGTESARVGSLSANAYGLHDMHGNVAEWTKAGTLRGGSFSDFATECRAAYRLRGQQEKIDRRFGFRVMLQPAKTAAP